MCLTVHAIHKILCYSRNSVKKIIHHDVPSPCWPCMKSKVFTHLKNYILVSWFMTHHVYRTITLKMEARGSSELQVTAHQTTLYHNPETKHQTFFYSTFKRTKSNLCFLLPFYLLYCVILKKKDIIYTQTNPSPSLVLLLAVLWRSRLHKLHTCRIKIVFQECTLSI